MPSVSALLVWIEPLQQTDLLHGIAGAVFHKLGNSDLKSIEFVSKTLGRSGK